jgi:sugar phosphate isomerase/epimerase
MYLTGFSDEAAEGLEGQIDATMQLGWNAIESRAINGTNIHDLPDDAFDAACGQLAKRRVYINCFGSTIANWSSHIEDRFEPTLAAVERAITRMRRTGTRLIRIMSYARRDDGDQMAAERFRRLREITARFTDAGITPVHENCQNYGGMSWRHTLEMLDQVPGLKLVYDTGNPVTSKDYSAAGEGYQDPWEFYQAVRPHIAYVHIKDAVLAADGTVTYTFPGEGDARIVDILRDLKAQDYTGGLSIEPHMASVFHDPAAGRASQAQSTANYLAYGRRLMAMLDDIDYPWKPFVQDA